ncbi:cobalt-precorrin-5B (C(1))-methyltransferase CbiD [Propionispira arboris]|uniref:cobalt-precorrin-5B (C(1))-methyltransferase CbiD n=1 Tax=Propionispira arboris TaxID=84035 RepID=UPI000B85C47F|nr:cobalt-precorrin-5B (C(1))-methyltransferase CbiD [Propionispira arboris]
MEKRMKNGFTTGACAAAGTKAALLALQGETVSNVTIMALSGETIQVPIASIEFTADGAKAKVIKDAGDDPDITHGASVFTQVQINRESSTIRFFAGLGIGTVTKPGLSIPMGEPSINLGPREMIQMVVREILGEQTGCDITISIPDGIELAKRTLNPVLGIEGGLSIIGTTGIVRPMSEDGFKNSLSPQISVAKALGYDSLVFVPGKIGEKIALEKCHLPSEALIQTSNFIGHMLEVAAQQKIKRVLLFGHLGKLIKVAAGIFYTHNRIADARLETLAAYAGALGLPAVGIAEVLASTTTEAAISIIENYNVKGLYDILAQRASLRAQRYLFNEVAVGTVLITLNGELLGMDAMAKEIGKDLGWTIK